MKVYKGTDKNMQCRGMQYKLGQKETAEDAIRCGDKGLHSCEAPMDVWRYYPPVHPGTAGGALPCPAWFPARLTAIFSGGKNTKEKHPHERTAH